MENIERKLERYVAFKGKPFSLDECVMEVGVSKGIISDGLRSLERDGKVREVRGLWIPLGKREDSNATYDFRFKRKEIKAALELITVRRKTKTIAKLMGISRVKCCRLMRTLYYMRLAKRSGWFWEKINDYKGAEVPWFWREVAAVSRTRYYSGD